MPKLHITFQDTTIKTLKQKAKEYNCSVPEFIERAMEALVLNGQTDELFFNPRPTNGNGGPELFTFIDLHQIRRGTVITIPIIVMRFKIAAINIRFCLLYYSTILL